MGFCGTSWFNGCQESLIIPMERIDQQFHWCQTKKIKNECQMQYAQMSMLEISPLISCVLAVASSSSSSHPAAIWESSMLELSGDLRFSHKYFQLYLTCCIL